MYEGTDTRALGLLIGASLAFVWKPGVAASNASGSDSTQASRAWRSNALARHLLDLVGLAGLAVVIVMMVRNDDNAIWLYQGGFAVLALATAAALLPLADEHSWMTRIVGLPPLRWLGERSYGIYLWHMPVIVVRARWVRRESPDYCRARAVRGICHSGCCVLDLDRGPDPPAWGCCTGT